MSNTGSINSRFSPASQTVLLTKSMWLVQDQSRKKSVVKISFTCPFKGSSSLFQQTVVQMNGIKLIFRLEGKFPGKPLDKLIWKIFLNRILIRMKIA
jgi:hypothetical protein